VTADGEETGSVGERMPHYLAVRVHHDLLNDVEIYVPSELVQAVEGGRVILSRTREQLERTNWPPPALSADWLRVLGGAPGARASSRRSPSAGAGGLEAALPGAPPSQSPSTLGGDRLPTALRRLLCAVRARSAAG
jgi:hypothetical protein